MNCTLVLMFDVPQPMLIGNADSAATVSLSPLMTAALNFSQNAFMAASAPKDVAEPTTIDAASTKSKNADASFFMIAPLSLRLTIKSGYRQGVNSQPAALPDHAQLDSCANASFEPAASGASQESNETEFSTQFVPPNARVQRRRRSARLAQRPGAYSA